MGGFLIDYCVCNQKNSGTNPQLMESEMNPPQSLGDSWCPIGNYQLQDYVDRDSMNSVLKSQSMAWREN